MKSFQAIGEASSPQNWHNWSFDISKDWIFTIWWVISGFLDPDPQTQLNPDPIQIETLLPSQRIRVEKYNIFVSSLPPNPNKRKLIRKTVIIRMSRI